MWDARAQSVEADKVEVEGEEEGLPEDLG